VAWGHSLRALVLGAGLGGIYGFLRPLGRRFPKTADSIFVAVMLWVWIYHSFGICGGDPRVGYLMMAAAGAFLWEWTLGRWVRSLWDGLWAGIFRILGTISRILKNIFKKVKIMFASLEKWGTIK
jgi:hypothetical protein